MKRKVVILTGSELRHVFFRKAIALQTDLQVISSYCEGIEGTVRGKFSDSEAVDDIICKTHLDARECSEKDFFSTFVALTPDYSNPIHISRKQINEPKIIEAICAKDPDLLISYGCSLVRGQLLDKFSGRFINVHLGLSPYYRGSGTNFWPLVNKEPEYVGATFMHIDAGVDTGEIIHQIRARIWKDDTLHQIGNRLITDMTGVFIDIIRNFDKLEKIDSPEFHGKDKVYKANDFNSQAVTKLYNNFSSGMIAQYLNEYDARCRRVPISENPIFSSGGIDVI